MRGLNLKTIFFGILFLVVYVYAARIGILIFKRTGMPPLVWLPSGIGLALLVVYGIRLWPLVFLGTFLISALLRHDGILASFIISSGSTIEPVAAVYLLRRFFPNKLTFTKVGEVFGFFMLVMAISNFLGATIDVGGLYLTGGITDAEFFNTWRAWWLGRSLGNLIVGTFLIILGNDIRYHWRSLSGRVLEATLLALAIGAVAALVFSGLAVYNHSLLIKPYFLFSLILWTSLRFDLMGATFANLAIVTASVFGMLQGYTAFPTYAPADRIVVFQFYLTALALTGLVVAASVREKNEALEARNEFLGIASHELKTPITSLKMNLQMLRQRIVNKPDKTLDEVAYEGSLGKVDRQINRLVAIVEQLLDVSQVDRKRLELHREEVDLAGLIRNLLDRLSGTITTAKCAIETKLDPAIRGNWDPFRIEQVLENLVSNACKYAPGGPIRIETARVDHTAEIVVRDSGPGISETKRPFIFDRFVRASENPHVQGLGLGLFITRQIVRAHAGNISVESELGLGTRFTIRLPLASNLGTPSAKT